MGLDIGSGFVKIAEVDHGGDRPELSRAAMRPIPRGAVVDGEVVEPLRVVDAVREVLDDAGVESAEVVAALGGHDVFIKKVEMARMKRSDARRAIREEAARHVPFDIESVQLDFQILGKIHVGGPGTQVKPGWPMGIIHAALDSRFLTGLGNAPVKIIGHQRHVAAELVR